MLITYIKNVNYSFVAILSLFFLLNVQLTALNTSISTSKFTYWIPTINWLLKSIVFTGEVLQIHAHFHLKAASERISNAQLGGGMWIDVGVYLFNLVDFIYDEEPSDIQACGHVEAKSASDDGVDSDVVVNLSYPGGKFASLTTSFRCRRPNSAIISGSNGYIEIKPPFHAPTEFEVYIMDKDTTERHRHDLGGVHSFDKFCYPNSQGFAYEIEHVRECLDKRLKESPLVPWETTLRIARVADKIIQQIRK